MVFWHWLLLGLILLVIEILTPQLVVVWFALAALITGLAAYMFPSLAVQLAVFAAASAILFPLGWFWLRKNLRMSSNASANDTMPIGEAGIVVVPNTGNPPLGKVRFQAPIAGDDMWSFTADDVLANGDRCVVVSVDGAVVKVRKA